MRRTVLLLAVLVSSLFLNAQFVIDWQQCYGGENNDEAYGIIEMDDGFLVSGISKSPNSGMVDCDFGNYVGGGWLIKSTKTMIWNGAGAMQLVQEKLLGMQAVAPSIQLVEDSFPKRGKQVLAFVELTRTEIPFGNGWSVIRTMISLIIMGG